MGLKEDVEKQWHYSREGYFDRYILDRMAERYARAKEGKDKVSTEREKKKNFDWSGFSKRYTLPMFLRGINTGTGKWSCNSQTCSACPFANTPECHTDKREKAFDLAVEEVKFLLENAGKTPEEVEREKTEIIRQKARKSLFAKAYNDALERFNQMLGSESFTAHALIDIFEDMRFAASSEEGMCSICSKRRYCKSRNKNKRKPCEDFDYSYLKRFTDEEYDNLESCGDIDLAEEDLVTKGEENGRS